MEQKIEMILSIFYIVNFVLMVKYYLHMFQLNSYKVVKHFKWMRTNILKIICRCIFLILGIIISIINSKLNIITLALALTNIIINIDLKKAKIGLKLTLRVQRQIVTLLILGVAFAFFPVLTYSVRIGIIDICIPFLILLANFINKPVEKAVQNYYINSAKKMLEQHKELIVIGITGSYGKSSVKNFLYKVLSTKYDVLMTPKNYNTTLGVVKTIREQLSATNQIFICEMGATKLNDIKEICDLVKPKYGIITSIGPQHLESFKSIENVVKTKFELADAVKENDGKIFLNGSNKYIINKAKEYESITYGAESEDGKVDYNASNIYANEKGVHFSINNFDEDFTTEVLGTHNAINLAGAIAVADYFKVPHKEIMKQVKSIKSVEHRLQLIKNGDTLIIDDSYNSNPVSSKSAIDTLADFNGTKILVTPGLIELGDKEYQYNFELGEYATKKCDYIFLVGKNHSKPIMEGIKSTQFDLNNVFVVDRPEEAVNKVKNMSISGMKVILLENDLPDNYN